VGRGLPFTVLEDEALAPYIAALKAEEDGSAPPPAPAAGGGAAPMEQ